MSKIEEENENINVVPSQENIQIPNLDSVNALQDGFNVVIQKFQDANPETPTNVLMPFILNIMLEFPYQWLTAMGKQDSFVQAITSEANIFIKINEFRNAEEKQNLLKEAAKDNS